MPFNDNWTHLTDNVLNLYLTNSAIIGISVAIITLLIGVTTAWVTCFFNFPFRKTLSVILILPLAMPAYISAITYVGIFEDSNIIDIRNIYGAIFLISFVLYPYVYLLARSSFLEQSKEVFENSEWGAKIVSKILCSEGYEGDNIWNSIFDIIITTFGSIIGCVIVMSN